MRLLLLSWLAACNPVDKIELPPGEIDDDGDGFVSDVDCDDNDATVFPGAVETCDGDDEDCDGTADEGLLLTFWFDDDGDGFGAGADTVLGCDAPAGMAENDADCDDTNAAVRPGVEEACNGIDDDCDGEMEPGYGVWHVDADGDGFGDPATALESCTPDEGRILDGTDCDDTNPGVHPGAEEECDYDDDDCDGRPDLGIVQVWHTDTDGDGYGHMYNTLETCAPPEGYVLDGTDCRPGDAEAYPGARERCNDDDDDCDGEVDEDFELDGDGEISVECGGADCDDSDPGVFPGALEVCEDGKDNDCNGTDANCGYDGEIDLGTVVRVHSSSANFDAGRLVKIADMDADGVNDLVVATRYASSYSGGAYVVPGPITASDSFSNAGWRVQGSRATYSAGRSMGVGDVDGDGINDLGIGAPDGTDREWIVLGPITGNMNLTDAEIMFEGIPNTETGHGSDIADVNGDGIADAVIGAYEDPTGGYLAGTVFVHYGPLSAGTYDVDDTADARLIGEYPSAYAGRYVRAGADIDGDGIGDMLLAAPYASASGPYSGSAYVVYGGVTGDIDLASADGKFNGERPSDYAGEELAMGDVDGDGLADVILGSYDTANRNAGAAYVVFGPASGERGLADADIILRGESASQSVGLGLAAADLDEDGNGELLVGGIGDGAGGRNAGAAWLFFGPHAATLTLDDADAKFIGETADDQAGESVAFGDLDGDNILEVIVGAPAEGTGGSSAGAVYIAYSAD